MKQTKHGHRASEFEFLAGAYDEKYLSRKLYCLDGEAGIYRRVKRVPAEKRDPEVVPAWFGGGIVHLVRYHLAEAELQEARIVMEVTKMARENADIWHNILTDGKTEQVDLLDQNGLADQSVVLGRNEWVNQETAQAIFNRLGGPAAPSVLSFEEQAKATKIEGATELASIEEVKGYFPAVEVTAFVEAGEGGAKIVSQDSRGIGVADTVTQPIGPVDSMAGIAATTAPAPVGVMRAPVDDGPRTFSSFTQTLPLEAPKEKTLSELIHNIPTPAGVSLPTGEQPAATQPAQPEQNHPKKRARKAPAPLTDAGAGI